MPLSLISWGSESVLAEYIDNKGKVYPLPEILGEFSDEQDAKLAALDEADRLNLITSGQKLAIRRHIVNPPTKEFLTKISRSRKKTTQ